MLVADLSCRLNETTLTIFDGVATTIGEGFGALLSVVEEGGGMAGDVTRKMDMAISAANVLLAYAKFLQTYASLEITLSAEGGLLVRTKDSIPGAKKKLQARIVLNIGNWEIYNCLRTSINIFFGADFSTMADGPVKGAGVMWYLDEGGDRDMYSNRTGLTGKEGFVGYIGDNPGRPRGNGCAGR